MTTEKGKLIASLRANLINNAIESSAPIYQPIYVAYFDRPESLHLRLVSNAFAQHPFFQQIFSYTLGLDSRQYSINQETIKETLDVS